MKLVDSDAHLKRMDCEVRCRRWHTDQLEEVVAKVDANFDDIEVVDTGQMESDEAIELEATISDIDRRLYAHRAHVDRLDKKIALSIACTDSRNASRKATRMLSCV